MYTVSVKVTGVSPLMQHRFPMPDLNSMSKGGRQSTGSKDYTEEWKEYFYATASGDIYQPAVHFEQAITKAAGAFKISGKRGATYKELFKSSVFINPDQILHNVKVPEVLDADADKQLYLDCRPVVIQKARVVRIRPTFKPGWELEFNIEVIDDGIQPTLLNDILTLCGKTVGIGDFRPRFGRFMVSKFEVNK